MSAIDRVLLASQKRIGQVLAKNTDLIPSFGWTGPDGAGEETTVKELENNNYHVFLILQDFKNMCMYYLNIKRDFAVILELRENINVKDKIFLFGKKKVKLVEGSVEGKRPVSCVRERNLLK